MADVDVFLGIRDSDNGKNLARRSVLMIRLVENGVFGMFPAIY
jgi:hypothetical protein